MGLKHKLLFANFGSFDIDLNLTEVGSNKDIGWNISTHPVKPNIKKKQGAVR